MSVNSDYLLNLCLSSDLRTYDPYDIWKTHIGLKVKNFFNVNPILGFVPALGLGIYDQFLNNGLRWGYQKQEYPIVRALAAQVLLNEYAKSPTLPVLKGIQNHLNWLELNTCQGFSGPCWGLGFKWPAQRGIIYNSNTPHSTHTPYALEAFHLYTQMEGDKKFVSLIENCFEFYERDLQVMYEDSNVLATSYGPSMDRIVTNSVSYTLYSYAIFLEYFPELQNYIHTKIAKLYRFISNSQSREGSWLYSPNDPHSFIDCFHSCIVLKNLLKTKKYLFIEGLDKVVFRGYEYITEEFMDVKTGLFKRFTKSNKPSLIRFDLYDNAEVLNLANMIGDISLVNKLEKAIKSNFTQGNKIFSVIDSLGNRRNENTLRWAVLPYIYTLSTLNREN